MRRWEAALRLVGVGWYVGVCIVLGVFGGLWLDNKLNTKPILVIVGLILGLSLLFTVFIGWFFPISIRNKTRGKASA